MIPLLATCFVSAGIGVATYLMIGSVFESLALAVPAGCGVGAICAGIIDRKDHRGM